MSMQKLSDIRQRGLIPAKRHDAFLLALLLALLINGLFYVIQAILPQLLLLFTLLGVTPRPLPPEEEKQIPFVLVDPESLSEEIREDLTIDAEAAASREARQTEEVELDLPEDTTYRAEGVEELFSAPEGSPGLPSPEGNVNEEPAEPEQPSPEEAEPVEEPPVEEPPEQVEPEPTPEPEPALPDLPDIEPLPEIAEEPPPPEPPPEMPPEPAPEQIPEPEPEQIVQEWTAPLEPDPEPPPPEPVVEPLPEMPVEPVPDAPDLASLPITPDGFIDSSTQELLRVLETPPERQIEEPPERPVVQPTPVPVEQPERIIEPEQPEPPRRPDRQRQPPFKKIGGEPNRAGSPPRRATESKALLLDDDASLRYLQSEWGKYMTKVGIQLQESLNRQIGMSPIAYSAGQIKLRFGINPDGTLAFRETVYYDGSLEAERLMSERMIKEAAPFDPLTPEMLKDLPYFQNITVLVTLF